MGKRGVAKPTFNQVFIFHPNNSSLNADRKLQQKYVKLFRRLAKTTFPKRHTIGEI